MRIVCLISWYEEKPAWLAGLVASMAGTADHVVAVDGAYALYPRGRAHSECAQAEAIRETARGLSMGCTIHEPQIPWTGNEVEKRDFMFRLGETVSEPDDWYFIMDGDELLTQTGVDLHRACAETARDVGEVTMYQLREQVEPQERPYVTDLIEEQRIRIMFRAIRGLSVVDRHYHYRTPDGRYLWGDASEGPLAEAEDFSMVRVEHRNKSRDLWRAKDSRTYYDTRDSLGVEATHMPMMTDEETNAYLASVARERERYREAGDEGNVKHCDEELERVGPRRTPSRGAAQTRGS